MALENREIQTKVKHEILKQYLVKWGGIISQGLQLYNSQKPHLYTGFVYVDCFAYKGRYTENGSIVHGSPLIGIDALDRLYQSVKESASGRKISTYTILVEEDKTNYSDLLDSLRSAGYGERIVENALLETLRPGQIAVFHGDYREYLDEIVAFTDRGFTWSLYFIDPYGSKGIDLASIKEVVKQSDADAIIYYPYSDIQRKTGAVLNDTPQHNSHINMKYIDDLYGGGQWRKVVQSTGTGKLVMGDLVQLYEQVLRSIDPDVAVKKIPLRFPDRDSIFYYLFLLTRDGTGALEMNKILDAAEIRQYDYRQEIRLGETEQPQLIGIEQEFKAMDTRRPKPSKSDIVQLKEAIYPAFKGKTVAYRSVLKHLANGPYYSEDVKKAMNELKKEGKTSFEASLTNKTVIRFQ